MSLEIRLPLSTWPKESRDEIWQLIDGRKDDVLGRIFKDSVTNHIRENRERGTLWAAYKSEELQGVGIIGSRAAYSHLLRHGESIVPPEFRRSRIATSLYFAQVLQAVLEGRRLLEVTIVPSLSPWMKDFLDGLGYYIWGNYPQHSTGFRDQVIWGQQTLDAIDTFSERVPEDVTIQLRDTPKTRSTFEKNMGLYERYRFGMAGMFQVLRERVLTQFNVAYVPEEVPIEA